MEGTKKQKIFTEFYKPDWGSCSPKSVGIRDIDIDTHSSDPDPEEVTIIDVLEKPPGQ